MKYSWNAKTPMTSPDMVAKPIKWNPMSEDWKKRVEAMQLYNEDATAPWLTNEMKKTLRALRDRILTFGGDEVLLNTRDEDAEKVLERGQFFYCDARKEAFEMYGTESWMAMAVVDFVASKLEGSAEGNNAASMVKKLFAR